MSETGWDLPSPFIHRVAATSSDIDIFGHANNAVYLRWADETAWAHWESCGLTRQHCLDEDRGMAILRTEADYLGHIRGGEAIDCAVWIARSDGRLRAERWYQFRRADTGETVFRAVTKLVCFQLSTGRPARMTASFASHYARPPAALTATADALMTKLTR
ncbi:acyl-CoA thioesterase [Alkalicaulis satelles]|uniref:Acyl-CoA thioesterase n=1 Tax=Alkalicaulis satelles TaxID=2609175 RepID=A0A5M6ZCY2_9PROT|nr:acyl-CoA thioesterase [Alkalicaulis satelles]KAA5801687.1 acyl-CoA thioesterase [Alkalicaulis satelles]